MIVWSLPVKLKLGILHLAVNNLAHIEIRYRNKSYVSNLHPKIVELNIASPKDSISTLQK